MVLTFSVISIVSLLVYSIDVVFLMPSMGFSPTYLAIAFIIAIAYQFLIDGVFAFLVSILPNKWFGKDNKLFRVTKKHQKFYEALGVKVWKDKVWELGWIGGFSKKKILSPDSPEYVERFIIESNKGVVDHILGMIAGFSVILIFPLEYIWIMCVPVALINLVLNYMPVMILRYNIPKLQTLYKRAVRNKERKINENT